MKKSISHLSASQLKGKRALVRVDFNVPQNEDGSVSEDQRIQAALPTIEHLRKAGAKVVLLSHLGRPKGSPNPKYSLRPVAYHLEKLLGETVRFAENCIGEEAKAIVSGLKDGEVALLENVRFHPGEEKNDPDFAKDLAELGDVYVNDAFGTAHRAHASTHGVSKHLKPKVAGLLMEKEIRMLSQTLNHAERPFATVVGGAKVSSKIGVLENLIDRVDVIVIGGAMAFSFLKARGLNVGKSLVEDDRLDYCRKLEETAAKKNVRLILPVDVVCASEIKEGIESKVVDAEKMPSDLMGLDIGPKTSALIDEALSKCKTILWNGPMGVFETKGFEQGTRKLVDTLLQLTAKGAKTVVGGGDSVAALGMWNIDESKLTHVSTGGGASLEFIEGLELPGIAVLDEPEKATVN